MAALKIQMLKTWSGVIAGRALTFLPGQVLTGREAERVYGSQPDWCQVIEGSPGPRNRMMTAGITKEAGEAGDETPETEDGK